MPLITKTIGILLLCFAFVSEADMVAPRPIPIKSAVAYLEKTKDTEAATLVRIAQAIGVESISVMPAGGTEEASLQGLDADSVTSAIRHRIGALSKWEKTLKAPSMKRITDQRTMLEKVLGSNSHTWAWFLFQFGDSAGAKKLLLTRYSAGYEEVMKLTQAEYGVMGDGPLWQVEMDFRALDAFSNASEKADLQDKMSKMKIHVSRLPQSHIVT